MARFRTIRATGRVVLDIPQNAAGIASLPNIQLEDGDRFVVPSKPSTVNVVGAVYDQNSFLFRKTQPVGRLPAVGRGTDKERRWQRFVHHPGHGSVVSRNSQNGIFGNSFCIHAT